MSGPPPRVRVAWIRQRVLTFSTVIDWAGNSWEKVGLAAVTVTGLGATFVGSASVFTSEMPPASIWPVASPTPATPWSVISSGWAVS